MAIFLENSVRNVTELRVANLYRIARCWLNLPCSFLKLQINDDRQLDWKTLFAAVDWSRLPEMRGRHRSCSKVGRKKWEAHLNSRPLHPLYPPACLQTASSPVCLHGAPREYGQNSFSRSCCCSLEFLALVAGSECTGTSASCSVIRAEREPLALDRQMRKAPRNPIGFASVRTTWSHSPSIDSSFYWYPKITGPGFSRFQGPTLLDFKGPIGIS